MSDSILLKTAEAVASEIDAMSLGVSVEGGAVVSLADWDIKLPDAAGNELYCDVVPVTFTEDTAIISTKSMAFRLPVDVGFRRLLAQADRDSSTGRITVSAVDAYMIAAETAYRNFLDVKRLDAFGEAAIIPDRQRWITAYGATDKKTESILRLTDQFTSIFRLEFEIPYAF